MIKPILVIYFPAQSVNETVEEAISYFKTSSIANQYWILGVKSCTRDEVKVEALYPKDFDIIELEELKKQIEKEVGVIVK